MVEELVEAALFARSATVDVPLFRTDSADGALKDGRKAGT
jgi:hypothetical protein